MSINYKQEMESKNIRTRAIFWTKFVNDTTKRTMSKLQMMLSSTDDNGNGNGNGRNHNFDGKYLPFRFRVNNPLEHLKFLSEWTGLKTQQMQYMPKSYSEFEYKAKNWLNGRKAPNYALTLFPAMIHQSEAVCYIYICIYIYLCIYIFITYILISYYLYAL